jgi:hypothetical protein
MLACAAGQRREPSRTHSCHPLWFGGATTPPALAGGRPTRRAAAAGLTAAAAAHRAIEICGFANLGGDMVCEVGALAVVPRGDGRGRDEGGPHHRSPGAPHTLRKHTPADCSLSHFHLSAGGVSKFSCRLVGPKNTLSKFISKWAPTEPFRFVGPWAPLLKS